MSVGSSNFSDEEEKIVSVDFVIRLEEKVTNEEVGPISRVVMLLMGKKQNGEGEYDWLKSSGKVNDLLLNFWGG